MSERLMPLIKAVDLRRGVFSETNKHPKFEGVYIKDLKGKEDDIPDSIKEMVKKLGAEITGFSVVLLFRRVPPHNHEEGEIYFSPNTPCKITVGENKIQLGTNDFIVIGGNVLHSVKAERQGLKLFSVKYQEI